MINKQVINSYISELKPRLDRILKTNSNEENIRPVFIELLNRCGEHKNLWVVTEDRVQNNKKPDGAIKNYYTVHGYWEAKSPDKNLDKEIEEKKKLGYPLNNTIFENSSKCVLFQHNQIRKEIQTNMWSDTALGELLSLFFNFQTQEIIDFNNAKNRLLKKENLSSLISSIEEELESLKNEKNYIREVNNLVNECKKFINPYFERKNVEQWLIQHVLTEQIFLKVFDEQQYLEQNNISKSIKRIERKFLLNKKQEIVNKIKPYINPITTYGTKLDDLNEKQLFLKDIYQNFYNSYDSKIADRFGVVYTPNEIVKFIVCSTNFLLQKHFGKGLKNKGVHILDPATGTGTFVTELMQHIFHCSNKQSLEYKYDNEIHANEHMVLPYYVANLNIEYVFQKLTNKRRSFANLVLMDTLQNAYPLKDQMTLDAFFFNENQKRVKKQNKKDIQVIIGNPPWNQHQKKFGDNNKNKEYKELRDRIRATYTYYSRAQKKKIGDDKYTFFLRWASDRIGDNGMISFVINRSFLDGKSGDGLRYCLGDEFNYIYVVDLGGDIRKGCGVNSNVFENIQVGNCIIFLIKKPTKDKLIKYLDLKDLCKKDLASLKLSKLQNESFCNYLSENKFRTIYPNSKYQWINQDTKFKGIRVKDIFVKTPIGISTNRDKDVYDLSSKTLHDRMKKLIKDLKDNPHNPKIALSSTLKRHIKSGRTKSLHFNNSYIHPVLYRENEVKYLYTDKLLVDRLTNNHKEIWGDTLEKNNIVLCWAFGKNTFYADVVNKPVSKDYFGLTKIRTYLLSLKYLKEDVNDRFYKKYRKKISKESIFHYIIGLFLSKKYTNFIQENNFDMKNPPIPLYENYRDYIKEGKKRVKFLK